MQLSIIIPCLNEADTIGIQLEALANQAWSQAWEIIVCDNGSTDGSVAVVEQYRNRLPNLRLVDASGRRGAAYARNVGTLAAAGELLGFCDADDEVAPGWVAAIGEALAKHDFVASCLESTKLNEAWVVKARRCPQQNGLQEFKYPPYLPHAAGSGLGVKRSLHEAIGGFDESLVRLEDTDYCWRLQLAGIDLHFVPNAIIHYRFRHTAPGIYCQAYGYAKHNVILYKKYRSMGMAPLPFCWKAYLKAWFRLGLKLPQIRQREGLARWLWQFGWRMGHLQGSIKYRILGM